MLTLDVNLQMIAEESLARNIKSIADKNKVGKTSGWDAQSGAAVVIEVKTGGVLASATYPTFNPATFNQDYNRLYEYPLKAHVHRPIAGVMSGFHLKMRLLYRLETGVINEKTTVTCTESLVFCSSYRQMLIFLNTISHGTLNVRQQ